MHAKKLGTTDWTNDEAIRKIVKKQKQKKQLSSIPMGMVPLPPIPEFRWQSHAGQPNSRRRLERHQLRIFEGESGPRPSSSSLSRNPSTANVWANSRGRAHGSDVFVIEPDVIRGLEESSALLYNSSWTKYFLDDENAARLDGLPHLVGCCRTPGERPRSTIRPHGQPGEHSTCDIPKPVLA